MLNKPSSAIPEVMGDPFTVPKWNDFIQRHPDQKGSVSYDVIADLNKYEVSDIEGVNNFVNNAPYTPDQTDKWELNRCGDCEDKALYKRYLLSKDVDIPLSAMRLTIGKTRDGRDHAALTLRTTTGDYLLDNNQALIVPWHKGTIERFTMWHIGGPYWQRLAAIKGITREAV